MKTFKSITLLASLFALNAFAATENTELTKELKLNAGLELNEIAIELENAVKVDVSEVKLALVKEAKKADFNKVDVKNVKEEQVAE
ncbi:hypothetical protein C2869_15880 [Saccharobesus litoralis]|uniref:Uncharacterized protein n=1 Tax=Saccharobesus litoralis TaxID=2172099 RepID=A0A2S0VUB3_9ALTE|nr:hypothetical protein [Saccharobesus litoralis]AWB67814.1 hypothetical protein C2869_15880 [Saccharobesus litoralis]